MDIEKIKKVMKENKITQLQLAELSGIPIQTLRKIFAGYTSNPRIDTVQAIEKALGITNEQPVISPKTKEIVDLLMQLDDEKLSDALAVIQIIAKK